MNNLPAAYRDTFRKQFVPHLRQMAGESDPWEHLSETEIRYIWSSTFQENSQLSDDLIWVISKLVSLI